MVCATDVHRVLLIISNYRPKINVGALVKLRFYQSGQHNGSQSREKRDRCMEILRGGNPSSFDTHLSVEDFNLNHSLS